MRLPSSRRIALFGLAAALVVLLAAAIGFGLDLYGSRHGDHDRPVGLDSRTSAGTALPASGPLPGTFRVVRKANLTGDLGEAAGQLISAGHGGIQAYDPTTGKPSWHYRVPGREWVGYAVDSGIVVVDTTNANGRHTAGLDAATGRIRWQSDRPWSLDNPSEPPNRIDVAEGGTVVLHAENTDDPVGVDVRTGRQRWSFPTREACRKKLRAVRGSGPSLLIRTDCAVVGNPATTLYALVDASTGKPRWIRQAVDHGTRQIRSVGGVTMDDASTGNPVTLLGPDGRRVFDSGPGEDCQESGCAMQASGRYVTVVYQGKGKEGPDGPAPYQMAIVDTKTLHHRVVTLEGGEDELTWRADGAGHLYRIAPTATDGETLPVMLERMDLAIGKHSWSPLPVPAYGPNRPPIESRGYRLEAVSGDQVAVSHRTTSGKATEVLWLTRAGGREPYQLGGVSPRDWPDACRLLDGVQQRPGARLAPATGELVRHRTCAYGSDVVSINWVAADDKQMTDLVGGRRGPFDLVTGRRLSGPAGCYRIGRMVFTIDPDVSPADVPRILENAARLAPR